jgi:hypothetical protein
MKKIILTAVLFMTAFAQAQIVVMDGDVQIENNETYTYTTTGIDAKMHLKVINGTLNTIYTKLKMELMTNNDEGQGVQFCYGQLCYGTVQNGSMAPTGGHTSATTLGPGENNGSDGYFYNSYTGDVEGQPVLYKMSLVNIDEAGEQVGDPIITFTYKYDATAATSDFASLEKMGISVNNTIIKNTLDITANQNAAVQIVNINGQTIKNYGITNGSQSLDLSSVATGVYFARFTTEENKTAQIKIVKN